MKKALLFIAIALSALSMSAQQIYNGSFEHWGYPTNPDGWGTWSTATSSNTLVSDSMMRFARKDSLSVPGIYTQDTSSVRLTVDTITLPFQGQITLAGFVALGGAYYVPPPDTAPGLYYGFTPYNKKPDSLILDYKYVAAAGFTDTAYVGLYMFRFDSLSQRELTYIDNSWYLYPTSGWVHLAIPLANLYQTVDSVPDSMQVIIISSVSSTLHIGTTLWIDSIHFDASVNLPLDTPPAGIIDVSHLRGITAYPNPASESIHILAEPAEVGSTAQLYDADGRQVYTGKIDAPEFIIPSQNMPPGIYTLRVYSNDHITVYSGRITVIRKE